MNTTYSEKQGKKKFLWFKKLSTFSKVNLDVIQWFPRVWGPRPVANNSPNIKFSAVLALAARMKLKALTVSRCFLKHCPLLQCVMNINWLINILFHIQANGPVTSFHILIMRSVSFSRKRMEFHGIKKVLLGKRFLYLPKAELLIITVTMAVPSSGMTSTSWTVASL